MKYLFIILITTLISCTKDSNEIDTIDIPLVGVWELNETLISDGGLGGDWFEVPLEDRAALIFNSDSTFTFGDGTLECNNGAFNLEEGILVFMPTSNSCGTVTYGFVQETNDEFTMFDQTCTEICAFRYIRRLQ
ncbi:hypothetical protein ULMA_04170 [Patiriisocius marinus]|uniref:Lipocalin-like domain-containing protein n=1 Tax=Patiriisocius marinus TaxID=1397112 RepID=A0A5J4IM93_9FLAO|nr:hypothetical protein [Patiriisocius marinus]GER58309.1 hypothetical protein ULMA_04170 [Patiriisocius marinus]